MNLHRYYFIAQVEFCSNLLFRRHFPIDRLFKRSCKIALASISADRISQFFGQRLTRCLKGNLHTTLDAIHHGHHVLRDYCKHSFVKQYEKLKTFLRIATCCNNLSDFHLKKALDHLPEVSQTMHRVNDRFAQFQAATFNVHIDSPLFQRLALPISCGESRIPGIKIQRHRPARVPSSVIINGEDLNRYTPQGLHERPSGHQRLLVVEGSLAGGQSYGIYNAADLARTLSKRHKVELMIVGRVDGRTKTKLKNQTAFRLQFMDVVSRDHIPWLMRSSLLLYSAEINPPCPNSVIEALACGLPVTGFDTGSLAEIVQVDAGRLVPYGADHWKLKPPDIPSLANAVEEVWDDQPRFRKSARERAEAAFDVEKMVDEYLKVLL